MRLISTAANRKGSLLFDAFPIGLLNRDKVGSTEKLRPGIESRAACILWWRRRDDVVIHEFKCILTMPRRTVLDRPSLICLTVGMLDCPTGKSFRVLIVACLVTFAKYFAFGVGQIKFTTRASRA
jgi:hypothetical protein